MASKPSSIKRVEAYKFYVKSFGTLNTIFFFILMLAAAFTLNFPSKWILICVTQGIDHWRTIRQLFGWRCGHRLVPRRLSTVGDSTFPFTQRFKFPLSWWSVIAAGMPRNYFFYPWAKSPAGSTSSIWLQSPARIFIHQCFKLLEGSVKRSKNDFFLQGINYLCRASFSFLSTTGTGTTTTRFATSIQKISHFWSVIDLVKT